MLDYCLKITLHTKINGNLASILTATERSCQHPNTRRRSGSGGASTPNCNCKYLFVRFFVVRTSREGVGLYVEFDAKCVHRKNAPEETFLRSADTLLTYISETRFRKKSTSFRRPSSVFCLWCRQHILQPERCALALGSDTYERRSNCHDEFSIAAANLGQPAAAGAAGKRRRSRARGRILGAAKSTEFSRQQQ